ncbi:deoxynucleoside triphosphate triphosphohydrolase SAMHD1-like [Cyprinus carpio]|uniref:Deoxynucleoside triphosphate triphosphohydrolase SAMHD1-like n=1 Tax=Cyprinus carpio TaxID=7962 RepID=A0A9Q9VZF8_CYPCA|nr:deoxynucleoside triphosphate triphosphohydrolase SAMHD1-like [Cyprinus carpio]
MVCRDSACESARTQHYQTGIPCVSQIAALCHDLGHGPFSHLFDGMFIPEVQPDNKWQHEQASVQMFHCMRKKNGLDKMMKDYELNLKKDIIFIEELIQGRKTSDSPVKTC